MAHLRHTPDRRVSEYQTAAHNTHSILDVSVTTAEWGMPESHNFLSADGHPQSHSELANRSDHPSNHSQLATRASVRVVPWQVRDLKPHPSYSRLGIKVPTARLNALLEMGDDAFLLPLIVTSNGIDAEAPSFAGRKRRRWKIQMTGILRG